MTQKTLYSIAHRCNTPEAVRSALREGANAVECDVNYYDGRFFVQHDPGPGGADVNDFLQKIRKVADAVKERFALIIFDLKETISGPRLKQVHSLVRSLLPNGTGIKVIYSVSSLSRGSIFKGILQELDPQEALSIDESDYPLKVQHFFEGLDIGRSCYGNGITAALPEEFGGPIRESVRKAVLLKLRRHIIKFVYIWTIDLKSSMRGYLDLGVDGIMTNHADGLSEVLREKKYRSAFRLATQSDTPFAGEALPRYLINVRSKTIHDLNSEKGDCHIDRIRADRYFRALQPTRQIGFSRCSKCYPSK
jgi:Glycerophosphoryl diester phosphodiesterase family